MLSNLVIGSERVVLFVDSNSYEPFAKDLLQTIARSSPVIFYPKAIDIPIIESNFKANIESDILTTGEKANVILAPVSKLQLNNSITEIVNLVQHLKHHVKVKQIFIWCSTKNIRDDKLIPFLQYMSNIEVFLRDESELQILTKRNTGTITRKEYQYTIGACYEISVREKVKKAAEKQNTTPSIDPESLATFKITAGSGEQATKDALKLPYERTSSEPQTGHIHYEPDSDDDFDDEDPDEDLNI
ncbi:elongator complex protein 5 isoform X1 [Sitodiplosis mosellana]|uniref:elongator complex protein 5 isoform X1 n=1 Tax=Sitodiplosis mosellana TaxID=263140 RepID=UPI002443DACB|nr:elongator complex protein 5 isoform X1 [Sitodiplosis mosellana]